jgi:hypothetical protein
LLTAAIWHAATGDSPLRRHHRIIQEISPLRRLGSGLIDHSQKMTVAAIAMADMKVWAQRS